MYAGQLAPAPFFAINTETSSSSTTSGTTELETDSITAAVVSGNTYKVTHCGAWVQSVATDDFLVRIREDNTSGTQLEGYRIGPNTVYPTGLVIIGFYTASVTEDKTFIVSAQRSTGTGTCTRAASATQPSNLFIERVA